MQIDTPLLLLRAYTTRKKKYLYIHTHFLFFGDNMNATSGRLARVEKIKEALKSTSGSSLKRATALISLGLGLSKSKSEEFIELFKKPGYIKIYL